MAMVAQKSLLKAGASVLALAGMISKLNSKFSEEGTKKAKKGYEKEANIKQENKQIVNNIAKPEVGSFGIDALVGSQPEEKQVVENKKTDWNTELESLHPQQKQKFILSEEGAYYPIKAEETKTNIPVDEDVKGLIQVKQKNAMRAAAGKKSQGSYQDIKAKLTGRFATEHNIEDVWRSINLAPDIDDKMIKKAGLNKTQILEMWHATETSSDNALYYLFEKNNADQYGLATYEEDPNMKENFGPLLSEYIKAKADGRTLEEKANEYWKQENFQNDEEETYEVWQEEPELSEEEKEAQGIVF